MSDTDIQVTVLTMMMNGVDVLVLRDAVLNSCKNRENLERFKKLLDEEANFRANFSNLDWKHKG